MKCFYCWHQTWLDSQFTLQLKCANKTNYIKHKHKTVQQNTHRSPTGKAQTNPYKTCRNFSVTRLKYTSSRWHSSRQKLESPRKNTATTFLLPNFPRDFPPGRVGAGIIGPAVAYDLPSKVSQIRIFFWFREGFDLPGRNVREREKRRKSYSKGRY